jgi:hypothetical protein
VPKWGEQLLFSHRFLPWGQDVCLLLTCCDIPPDSGLRQARRAVSLRDFDQLFEAMDWQPIDPAPFDQCLELSVIEDSEVHALVFPCRRAEGAI